MRNLERALAACRNEDEVVVMVCGILLGLLARISDEQFEIDEAQMSAWPSRLVAAMRRVAAMPARPAPMTEWFLGAGELLVALERRHGMTAAN